MHICSGSKPLKVCPAGGVGCPEVPVGRDDVPHRHHAAVVGLYHEGQALAVEVRRTLPIHAPVPAHREPVRVGPLDPHLRYYAAATDVGHRHQLEVVPPVDGEPHAATSLA